MVGAWIEILAYWQKNKNKNNINNNYKDKKNNINNNYKDSKNNKLLSPRTAFCGKKSAKTSWADFIPILKSVLIFQQRALNAEWGS